MSTLCVGSSHVKRFQSYCGTLGSYRTSADLFRISDLAPVNFFGISGGTVSNSCHLRLIQEAVKQYRPLFVIVQLGGNDLDNREDIVDLVIHKLVAFLTQLRQQFDLRKITVIRLLPRENTRHVNKEDYNKRVIQANTLLKCLCHESGLSYWRLRGFTNSTQAIFLDGVHLNSSGMHKYFRQIRGILLSQSH